ncbi:hypothetical protein BDZ89DRAFT_1036255 [Hymenopellis radicata]|nr:hypothetical protein BDZ89DRAFT_1036255 [Hymenopellis radicata]
MPASTEDASAVHDLIPWYRQSSGVPSLTLSTSNEMRISVFAMLQLKEMLPDAKYTPVTWEEARSIFSFANDDAVTDAHFSAVCLLMVTKIEGRGRAFVVVRRTNQIFALDPVKPKLPYSFMFAARMCPPTGLRPNGRAQQDIGIFTDPGIVIHYQVSYWKKH